MQNQTAAGAKLNAPKPTKINAPATKPNMPSAKLRTPTAKMLSAEAKSKRDKG